VSDVAGNSLAGWTRNRLRLWLALFFLALAIPTALLVRHAYSQLKWETFHQYQLLAEELGARIDGRFIELVNKEEARTFADYAFLVVTGDPAASFLQRSPLSSYPATSDIPGLVGYFQIDAEGTLSTPLLPRPGTNAAEYGITREELAQRTALADRLQHILGENRLVQQDRHERLRTQPADTERRDREAKTGGLTSFASSSPAPVTSGGAMVEEESALPQAAFDRLNQPPSLAEQTKKQEAGAGLGRVEDLNLDYRYQQTTPPPSAATKEPPPHQILADNMARLEKRGARKELSALPELQEPTAPAPVGADETRETDIPSELAVKPSPDIRIFESEVDPFELALLDSGHFVLFRKVWRDGQRYIQGALIEQQPLLHGVIDAALRETALAQMSDLVVAWQGRVLSVRSSQAPRGYLSSTEELTGAALYQTRLSAPLGDMELLLTVNRLPSGAGSAVLHWLSITLAVVLLGGFYFMYRLGVRQIALARQQQDFVSAVSHELKTPLTSIRMYGEMLREGWAPEEKKRSYYDYIHDESERLSRLIANVLQLARMTRNDLKLAPQPVTAGELLDGIRSKISSHIERAGFDMTLECVDDAGDTVLNVDADAFSQILINLVDNAIKFSAKAELKAVDISCRRERNSVVFSVRDHGPGVERDQMKKIFGLFYRSENELTRETLGTGIGLALVNQLTRTMGGKVDVINREPGAEFRITFPIAS